MIKYLKQSKAGCIQREIACNFKKEVTMDSKERDHKDKDHTREVQAIKAELRQQYFGSAKPSFVVEKLIDSAAILVILNGETQKEILKGKKADSQFTAKVNTLNRIFRDLERLRQQPEGYDLDQGSG
jgi:hypothetical protein